MRVLLLQLDGRLPNLALCAIAAHHRAIGDEVELCQCRSVLAAQPGLFDKAPDMVYASLIFQRSRPVAEAVRRHFPGAVIGGTGWDYTTRLDQHGIDAQRHDYSDYPAFRQSMGFTQRGCRLACEFCCVPKTEGKVKPVATIWDIWRGEPWPRELLLLDNDFFGQPDWSKRIEELKTGRFKVSFNQGINARMLNDETAAAIASVDYRDDGMKNRRIYTAWDSKKDERTLFRGLESLVRHGVKPDNILIYMLIGFWADETDEDWLYRHDRLREFGCRPYPMPFVRKGLARIFQTWCVAAYDKRVSWQDWKRVHGDPRKLGTPGRMALSLFEEM